MALLRVLCWALIFILRLRFPPGSSIASILNNRYNNGSLEAFRKFQRLEMKLGKAKLDLDLLKNCKKRSVIPKFLRFKVANQRLRNSSAYRQCQNKLLQDEIADKTCENSCVIITSDSRLFQSSCACVISRFYTLKECV